MRQLDAFDGAIPTADFSTGNPNPGTVDLGDTAWAALSLVAAGTGKTQVAAALVTLNGGVTVSKKSTAAKVASSAATDSPALLGLAALANSAGGSPSSTVTALVTRIGATQRGAATTPSSSPSATPSATTSASPTDPAASPTGAEGNGAALPDTGATSLTGPLAVGGLVLVFLGGLALLFSRRAGTHA